MATNVNNREIMYSVRKVEQLIDENDDHAKKIADNSKKIRGVLAAVKKQISLSEKKVGAPKRQIRSLERVNTSVRGDRPRMNDNVVQVTKDRQIDEERNLVTVNDIEAEVSGGDVREEVMSNDDNRERRTSDDNLRHAGTTEDDIVVADKSVDEIKEVGIDDNDVSEVGTSKDDVRRGVLIIPVDESTNHVEVGSEQLVDHDKKGNDENYSRVNEDTHRQIIKYAMVTIENSDKILERLKKELIEIERHSDQGRSPEWMERMEKKSALLKKKMSAKKSLMKKMESKIRIIKMELEKRKLPIKKKIIEARSHSGESSSSVQRLKRKLNESAESVIDCGMIRKVSAKEEGVMIMKELMKEENPSDDVFACNYCPKVFTSAGPLTAHLLNHSSGNKQQRLDCPWSDCSFANTHQNLTKHIRSKHTKEELFRCVQCPKKFHTMDTKLIHEKKHGQQNDWDHCEHCLRFYKSVRGGCSYCQKKY